MTQETKSLKENLFTSQFVIGDEITFRPMFKHQKEMGIADEDKDGKIVAIRFTEAKVFYDIYDPYWGKIFDNVDSTKVWQTNYPALSL